MFQFLMELVDIHPMSARTVNNEIILISSSYLHIASPRETCTRRHICFIGITMHWKVFDIKQRVFQVKLNFA